MNVTTTHSGQNIMDVVIQETGSIEGLLAVLRNNDLAANDVLPHGTVIKTNDTDVVKADVREFYRRRDYIVNTSVPAGEEAPPPGGEGIGFWIIEDDFIVQ